MTITHTPGPWTIGNPIFSGPYYIMVGGHTEIARVSDAPATSSDYYIKNHDEREANARLIAAAPDLLAALQDFVWRGKDMEAMGIDSGDMAKARAAIAKATSA